jgi:hypothetical protein
MLRHERFGILIMDQFEAKRIKDNVYNGSTRDTTGFVDNVNALPRLQAQRATNNAAQLIGNLAVHARGSDNAHGSAPNTPNQHGVSAAPNAGPTTQNHVMTPAEAGWSGKKIAGIPVADPIIENVPGKGKK